MSNDFDPTGGIRTARDCYGEFIAAEDLGDNKATVRIVRLRKQEFDDPQTKAKERKVVVTFEPRPDGTPRKEWIAGPISIEALRAMFGDQVKSWIGKRITLYATDKVMPFPGQGPCVRVYGSPDITKPVESKWKVRQRIIKQTLVPTGEAPKADTKSTPDAPPAPVDEGPHPFFDAEAK